MKIVCVLNQANTRQTADVFQKLMLRKSSSRKKSWCFLIKEILT